MNVRAGERVLEVYFKDLTEEAQQIFLDAYGITDPKEGNFDLLPIAEIPVCQC